jgi:hypothetical protein
MLWSRSASLMSRTRRSLAIATSILRIVAACWASLESNWIRSSLVTPSTRWATSSPNPLSTSAEGDLGVLDGVVQQGRDDDVVEADVGHDRGDRERVVDVGSGPVRLAPPCRRPVDHVDAAPWGGVRAVAREQRRQLGRRGGLVVPPPGQDSSTVGMSVSSPRQYAVRLSTRCSPSSRGRRGRRARAGTRTRRSRRRASRPAGPSRRRCPPVASTSSTTSTRSPGWIASRWISSLSVPYSSSYSSRATAHGSLPALRTGHEPGTQPVGDRRGEDEPARLDADDPVDRDVVEPGVTRSSTARPNAAAFPSRGVMSRNVTPGLG